MKEELQKALDHIKEAYKKRHKGQETAFEGVTDMDLRLIMQQLEDAIYFSCDGCKYQGRSPEFAFDCKLCRRSRYGNDMYRPKT